MKKKKRFPIQINLRFFLSFIPSLENRVLSVMKLFKLQNLGVNNILFLVCGVNFMIPKGNEMYSILSIWYFLIQFSNLY